MPHKLTIRLPWPPKECNPNSRLHWAKRHRAAKSYREYCHVLTRQVLGAFGVSALGKTEPKRGEVDMGIDFYPPNRNRRDDDNLVAAFKSGRDGIADALRLDDQVFRIHPFLSDEVRKGGEVVVTIKRREGREAEDAD